MSALFAMNRDCRCGGHFELVVCEHGIGVDECVRCQAKAAATDLLANLHDAALTLHDSTSRHPLRDDVWKSIAAARRFLALTETGQEFRDIDYCVEHFESAWSPDECWKQVYGEDDHYVPWDSPCRIVRVQLIPADYLTEEET